MQDNSNKSIEEVHEMRPKSDKEKICLDFVSESMSREDGGVYTNYLESGGRLDYSTGHEILSESVGLMMLYYVESGEKSLFDVQLEFLINNMLMPNGLIRWRVYENSNGITETSSSIDDLRIIRALIKAYESWNEANYLQYALEAESMVFEKEVVNGSLVNYYNQIDDESAKLINLCYIDFKTMSMLSRHESNWLEIMQRGFEIVESGMISDGFPMYKKTYSIEFEKYLSQESINILDSLTTIMHLSEIGKENQKSIDWIRDQLENDGGIVLKYSTNGSKLSQDESTAAYAIVSRIAKNIGDNNLYNKSMSNMIKLQVTDPESEIYGSFGYEGELEVFSYDNLQALLAFRENMDRH